jgi:hypothetical protein
MADFQRHPWSGAPFVNSAIRKTRTGKWKRVMYGRPSNFGMQIESAINLQRWSERMTLIGSRLVDTDISKLDPEVDDDRQVLDQVVIDAKDAAGAFLAARRGTAVHLITANIDKDEESALSIIEGERYGITPAVADALIACWDQLRTATKMRVLCVEQTVVEDRWRLAGTLDRVVELGDDLHFGGIVVPRGTNSVLDVKTGKLRVDHDGHPQFWQSYCVQVTAYARSVPYIISETDPYGEHRDVWPFELSVEHGLLLHLDVARALTEGTATARLFHVDLVAGAMAGNLCRAARDWKSRRGIFRAHDLDPFDVDVRT